MTAGNDAVSDRFTSIVSITPLSLSVFNDYPV